VAVSTKNLPRVNPRPGDTNRPVDGDRDAISSGHQVTNALPIIPIGSKIKTNKTDRKAVMLGEGDYPMPDTVSTIRTVVTGVGTTIIGSVSITGPVQYTGVRFTGPISVSASGVLTLTGCETEQLITVVTGGRVLASNHLFSNVSAINNAGLATNCYISTSQRTSGVAHTNVTVFGEVA
jgi:hypothetical protein